MFHMLLFHIPCKTALSKEMLSCKWHYNNKENDYDIFKNLHYSNGFIAGKNAHILNGVNCIEFVLNTSVFVIMNIQSEVFQKFT